MEGNHTKLLQRPAHCTKGCFKSATVSLRNDTVLRVFDFKSLLPNIESSEAFQNGTSGKKLLDAQDRPPICVLFCASLKQPTAQALALPQPPGSPSASEIFQKLLHLLCEGCRPEMSGDLFKQYTISPKDVFFIMFGGICILIYLICISF